MLTHAVCAEQLSTVTYTVGSGWKTSPSYAYTKGPNSYAWVAKVGGTAVLWCKLNYSSHDPAVDNNNCKPSVSGITHCCCRLQVTFTNNGPNNVVFIVTDRTLVSELPIIADATGTTVS